VEERSKSVVVPYFSSGLLIDDEGVVVDILDGTSGAGVPVVLGLEAGECLLGEKLLAGDAGAFEALLLVLSALRQADRDREGGAALAPEILTIDISDKKQIRLGLSRPVTINLGDGTDVYDRINTARVILDTLERDASGEVDFSAGAKPVFKPSA